MLLTYINNSKAPSSALACAEPAPRVLKAKKSAKVPGTGSPATVGWEGLQIGPSAQATPELPSLRGLNPPRISQEELSALLTDSGDAASGEPFDCLRTLSHDMRTPIASILALSEQMLRESGPGAESIRRVMRHAEHLMQMMDGFIAHSQARSESSYTSERLVEDLVDEAVLQAQDLARHRGMTLTVNGGENFLFVQVTSQLMVRALLNVLLNAIKYGEPGSAVTLDCNLSGSADQQNAEISVRNEVARPGSIPREAVLTKSCGIGLDFVQTVVRRHKGKLRVCIPASGTACVTLSLPCVAERI